MSDTHPDTLKWTPKTFESDVKSIISQAQSLPTDIKQMTIIGAISLSILRSSEYKQELWIFGEAHKIFDAKDCKVKPAITLIEYLSVFLSKSKFYDVFLEVDYNRYQHPDYKPRGSKGMIGQLYNILATCYTKSCPFLIRLHHSDFRNENITILITQSMQIRNRMKKWSQLTDKEQKATVKKLINFSNITQNIIDIKKIDTFLGIEYPNKIDIEIDRIDSKFTLEKAKLNKWYQSTRDKVRALSSSPNIRDITDVINKFIQNPSRDTMSAIFRRIVQFTAELLNSTADLLEIYTLARMFHRFQKITGYQTSTVERGIFFGGHYHALNMIAYLKSSGYTEVFHSESNTGCISVPE